MAVTCSTQSQVSATLWYGVLYTFSTLLDLAVVGGILPRLFGNGGYFFKQGVQRNIVRFHKVGRRSMRHILRLPVDFCGL